MAKCLKCDFTAMADSPYCYYHNPDVPDNEKKAAKAKGGRHSRTIPHALKAEDFTPIRSTDDLISFYNALLAEAVKEPDAGRMIRNAMAIAPKLADSLQLRILEAISQRLEVIESRATGRLLGVTTDHPSTFEPD